MIIATKGVHSTESTVIIYTLYAVSMQTDTHVVRQLTLSTLTHNHQSLTQQSHQKDEKKIIYRLKGSPRTCDYPKNPKNTD